MPEEIIRARPRLCLARGWYFFMGPVLNLESAEEWAENALRVAQANGSLDSDLTGEAAALRAMVAATRSQVGRSLELSRQALDDLPLDSAWRSAVVFCLGTAHYLSGDMAAAFHVFEEAMRLSQADEAHHIQLNSASFLAEILVFQGRLRRATEMYQQVLAWADPGLPQKGVVMAHGGLADVYCEQDQLDAALAHVQLGVDQVGQVGGAWSAHLLYRVLARVQQARGNWADAIDALQRTDQIAQDTKIGLIAAQVAALRARLQLAQGDLGAATTWAANSELGPDDAQAGHPGWREVGYLSLARVLVAQGKHTETLALLASLLKAAESEGRFGSVITILALQSLVLQKTGSKANALTCLERALALGEPEGYVRIFVDEGEPMRLLLLDYQSIIKQRTGDGANSEAFHLLTYTDKLLAAFSQSASVAEPKHEILPETLSERELAILRFIAAGYSNLEIAEQLVLAQSTVKWYINHLYSKLGAKSRTHALAIARELELI